MSFKYFTHNWLIKGILDREVHRMLGLYASGSMLDIGCGDRPYYSCAMKYVDSYTGADYSGTPHLNDQIDLFCDAYDIPVDDVSFDCVLCTEVLEHLEEPSTAIQEAYRLLKKGGYALYTVPFSWPIHEAPRDFYRYTKYGLKYLFEKNGFEVIEINALDGFAVKTIQPIVYAMQRLRQGGRINPLWWVIPVIGSLMQALALYANNHRKNKDNPNTDHYSIVVRKP